MSNRMTRRTFTKTTAAATVATTALFVLAACWELTSGFAWASSAWPTGGRPGNGRVFCSTADAEIVAPV